MFYLTGYTITFKGHGSQQSFTTSVTNPYTNAVNPGLEGAVNGFLGDTGIPMSAGHYGFHPAPGVAGMLQVSFRPGH